MGPCPLAASHLCVLPVWLCLLLAWVFLSLLQNVRLLRSELHKLEECLQSAERACCHSTSAGKLRETLCTCEEILARQVMDDSAGMCGWQSLADNVRLLPKSGRKHLCFLAA